MLVFKFWINLRYWNTFHGGRFFLLHVVSSRLMHLNPFPFMQLSKSISYWLEVCLYPWTMMATTVEICVISLLYGVSAISCSSCSILVLCWCFLCIYLYGIPASEYLILFFVLFFFLSFPPYFSGRCFVFHCCLVPLEAKVCFFCWQHEWLVALICSCRTFLWSQACLQRYLLWQWLVRCVILTWCLCLMKLIGWLTPF